MQLVAALWTRNYWGLEVYLCYHNIVISLYKIVIFGFYQITSTNFGQIDVPRTVLETSGADNIKTHQGFEFWTIFDWVIAV